MAIKIRDCIIIGESLPGSVLTCSGNTEVESFFNVFTGGNRLYISWK